MSRGHLLFSMKNCRIWEIFNSLYDLFLNGLQVTIDLFLDIFCNFMEIVCNIFALQFSIFLLAEFYSLNACNFFYLIACLYQEQIIVLFYWFLVMCTNACYNWPFLSILKINQLYYSGHIFGELLSTMLQIRKL